MSRGKKKDSSVAVEPKVVDEVLEVAPTTAPAPTVETPVIQAPVSEYAGLSMMDKVDLMANMRSALLSEDVKKAILSKPSGDRVYKIFTKAMEAEVGKMMGGESPIPEASVTELMGDMFDALGNLTYSIRLFSDQKLIQLLASMLQHAGGFVPQPITKPAPKPTVQRPEPTQQGLMNGTEHLFF